ncbi:hypothetical protein LCGC14_0669400 [marine sediment metagenome]|uniref:Uncharacterized protein n=1 Tax=marine sediment metagenome TaxID=412755 RepID=A0A0F9TCZ1_9ZZZZ
MSLDNEELLFVVKTLREVQEGTLLAMREMNVVLKDLEKRVRKLEETQKTE